MDTNNISTASTHHNVVTECNVDVEAHEVEVSIKASASCNGSSDEINNTENYESQQKPETAVLSRRKRSALIIISTAFLIVTIVAAVFVGTAVGRGAIGRGTSEIDSTIDNDSSASDNTDKNYGEPASEDAVPTFTDVTLQINLPSNNWDGDDLKHSFRALYHHHPATFTDWDNDGFLDYFNSNHNAGNPNIYSKKFDFGLNRPGDNVIVNNAAITARRVFQSIGKETFIDMDAKTTSNDCHGATFADMDGDGVLDLLISVGGGMGAGENLKNDNRLFWGTLGDDDGGNGSRTQFLAGGREAARSAGIECADCRGRFMLVTDANRDGKLDVFPISDVRVDNLIKPTQLLLNNGNRTFSPSLELQEYTRTILLTDADGDGHAQEYMVFRSTCFRDPSYGEYPESLRDFCVKRPEKTTAIYKFDPVENKMALISPSFYRSASDQVYTPWNNQAVVDAVSGDFDFDSKADQVLLFQDKLVFHYSSDYKEGLPLYNEDLGLLGSSDMKVPCSVRAVALRSADIDNDGQLELILMCSTPGEIFVLSLQSAKSWSWVDWDLGDLDRTSGWKPEPRDIEIACNRSFPYDWEWKEWEKPCRSIKGGKEYMPVMHGFQLIDLNNDGFMDAVLASSVGYQRFFFNNPDAAKGNRFIRIELKSTISNVHSIGTTLIFRASAGLQPQLREISSFGHGHARSGGIDDRIVFGLGQSAVPVSLTVRWPSMKEDFVSLVDLDAGHISNYSNPIVITEAS